MSDLQNSVNNPCDYTPAKIMSNLIDRQAVLGEILNIRTDITTLEFWREAHRRIYALPSAEPEIIRCKDCKWCVEHYDTDGNAPYWICKNWDAGTDADGFCYEAEMEMTE